MRHESEKLLTAASSISPRVSRISPAWSCGNVSNGSPSSSIALQQAQKMSTSKSTENKHHNLTVFRAVPPHFIYITLVSHYITSYPKKFFTEKREYNGRGCQKPVSCERATTVTEYRHGPTGYRTFKGNHDQKRTKWSGLANYLFPRVAATCVQAFSQKNRSVNTDFLQASKRSKREEKSINVKTLTSKSAPSRNQNKVYCSLLYPCIPSRRLKRLLQLP